MPQMDKEIFIEYFFCIFLILIQSFSNETVSENFLKINTRYFLVSFFKTSVLLLAEERVVSRKLYTVPNKASKNEFS